MELATLDTVAAYAALAASLATGVWAAWSKFRDSTSDELRELRGEVAALRSFGDRIKGAGVVARVVELEQRQRDSETAMARVEQRLTSIDTLLAQIASSIQQIAASSRDG